MMIKSYKVYDSDTYFCNKGTVKIFFEWLKTIQDFHVSSESKIVHSKLTTSSSLEHNGAN